MDDISGYVLIIQIGSIIFAVMALLNIVMKCLYRTRRAGYSWAASIGCTLLAAALFATVAFSVHSTAIRAGTRLGKDDEAVSIITNAFWTFMIVTLSAGLGSIPEVLWPTAKERAEKARKAAVAAGHVGA